jgi:hypothetical protein
MAYDNNGNRTSPNGGYTSNNLNQYTMFAGIGATYDGNGNLASYNGWSYSYDAQTGSRWCSTEQASWSSSGTTG